MFTWERNNKRRVELTYHDGDQTCLILIVNFCNLMLKFRNFKIIIVLHI